MTLSKITKKFEQLLFVPYAAFLLLIAEYSRYLVQNPTLSAVFAPRTLAIIAVLLAAVWFVAKKLTSTLQWGTSEWVCGAILFGLVTWPLVGLMWTPAQDARTYLVEFWLYGLALTKCVFWLVQNPKYRTWLFNAAIIGVAGVVVVGLVEKVTDTHLPLSNLHNPYREQWAITSVFINQNHLAACLALWAPVVFAWTLDQKKLKRGMGALLLAALLINLFFTGSIIAWVGLAISMLVMLMLGVKVVPVSKRKRFALSVGVALLSVIGVVLLLPSSVTSRYSVLAEGVQKSIAERSEIVGNMLDGIAQHPLRGSGPAATEHFLTSINAPVQNAHNLALELALNFGLIYLLACIVAVVFVIGKLVIKWWKTSATNRSWLGLGYAASLIGFVVVQAAPSSFVGVRAPFIIVGFALAHAFIKTAKSDQKDHESKS
jgi:O-antigen ligase